MNATLTLRNDYLFKRLLGAEDNKACLQDFLECAGIPQYDDLKMLYVVYRLHNYTPPSVLCFSPVLHTLHFIS